MPDEASLMDWVETWRSLAIKRGAQLGCALFSFQTGHQTGYQENICFQPASNQKLWTTAVSLDRLGADYHWKTHVGTDGKGLWIKGGGDPSFDYQRALQVAEKLKSAGLDRLTEPVVLDLSFFEKRPWGTGWMWDDLAQGFCAPVQSLIMERNRIRFYADPDESVPRLRWTPDLPTIHFTSDLKWTGNKESDLVIERKERGNQFHIRGELSRDDPEDEAAVYSGSDYFTELLLKACVESSVEVPCKPEILEGTWNSGLPQAWTFLSLPLSQILPWVNQDSDNLVAEVLLKTLGMELYGEGSEEKGKKAVIQTLQNWDLSGPANYADGSGLSGYNLATPSSFVELLKKMTRHPDKEIWWASLAEYGSSGTLKDGSEVFPPGFHISAKTGTIAGVKTLSGYVMENGEPLIAFSVLINGLKEEYDGEVLQNEWVRTIAAAMKKYKP